MPFCECAAGEPLLSQILEVSTPFGNCTTGEGRLVGGVDSSTSRSGRLEVCFNDAWGTVCDTTCGDADAAVACDQVIGFTRDSTSLTLEFSMTLIL